MNQRTCLSALLDQKYKFSTSRTGKGWSRGTSGFDLATRTQVFLFKSVNNPKESLCEVKVGHLTPFSADKGEPALVHGNQLSPGSPALPHAFPWSREWK